MIEFAPDRLQLNVAKCPETARIMRDMRNMRIRDKALRGLTFSQYVASVSGYEIGLWGSRARRSRVRRRILRSFSEAGEAPCKESRPRFLHNLRCLLLYE